MFFFNTEMHIVVALIIFFELLVLPIQIIYYLQRPCEKNRLWFLLLILMFVQYNITGGLLPDDRIGMPKNFQCIHVYATGVVMSLYFLFYLYKVFDLSHFEKNVFKRNGKKH